ncbi:MULTISPECIES: Glu/Leu/Phe/Val family dehydrogenase [unclassified Undibacterium]|uniref:Glu/Leu/Phe/Val family dehydrogenase n=1 Tax=unclassified Undibacterium TaxID=2630295 RepID=UPI002AC965CD|nr:MULTISPECIES: Glu/Leu/Phe/Val dehydrogenase dimerization domain-containing protein [unclassified Undibacterium]MEB0139282.1 Glu/Leu/Phe/Val dehydrogenase dimerization domain-containing protein [Undibacterium sp. CCC2.1]MEB0172126.1 Glu/Leu/Phe/Val dehydrogenase dimerization domain-containing protein [Undibacterium sp. CCC1.1]MEB0176001.1 Glu/Leu/Phe/Val dehydrogenase dimerization domain-containing protein [Undibacterium sp. CCC3.4]MEB0215313.1 Glu/Leu/Phe/Val dehydrogenase dimerization domai
MTAFVFNEINFDQHEQVVFASEAKSGLKAIIAVHNTTLGPAMGGCRMWNYSSEAEAVRDVLRLSRGMTYKNAVAGLPVGGGKSVIIGNPKTDKTPALFAALGEALERLGGRYVTAEDVGTSPQDMAHVAGKTKYVAGLGERGDPSPYTALGCFVGAQAAVKHQLGRDSLEGLTVAVQGLGHVGYDYARRLHQAGAKLIVADIDAAAVARAQQELQARVVHVNEIYDVAADIYAPCALGATLNLDTLARLQARIVAGAANNQLASAEIGAACRARGILYAPDFVINAGGIIKVCYEYMQTPEAGMDAHVRRIGETLAEIFSRADSENLPTSVVADRIAESRFKK